MSGALTVRISRSLEAPDRQSWDRLLEGCPDATCFQSHAWISSWWDSFRPAGEPALYTAYRDSQLVGLAPMYRASGTLCFIGEGHSDYNLFCCLAGEERIADALLDAMLQDERVMRILFEEVPATSTLGRLLQQGTRRKLRRLDSTPCPRLVATPENIARALHKKSVLRKRRRLHGLGDVRMDHYRRPGDIRPYLEGFFNQHVERWSDTEFPSLFRRDRNRVFYARLVDAGLPVLFSVLRVDGKVLAMHFGMLSSGTLIWYKPAFDIRSAAWSPGEVLLSGLVEYVKENRLDGLDFTRGNEAFKLRFSTETRHNLNYRYYRRTPYLADSVNLLKRAIKRMLRLLRLR